MRIVLRMMERFRRNPDLPPVVMPSVKLGLGAMEKELLNCLQGYDVSLEPHQGEKAIDWWTLAPGFSPLPIFLEHLDDAVYSSRRCLRLAVNIKLCLP
jgi:hypothetical protein